MKIWIDPIKEAPEGYTACRSVNEAKDLIIEMERQQQELADIAHQRLIHYDLQGYHKVMHMCRNREIELLDIGFDADIFSHYGGNYINLLKWLEVTNRNYPIHIHIYDPHQIEALRKVIRRNNWKEML